MRDDVSASRDSNLLTVSSRLGSQNSPGRTYMAKRTRRSDPVSTAPLPDGSYGRPTAYDAFFHTTLTGPGTARWTESFRRDLVRTWDGGGDWGKWEWGTTALIPNVPSSVISRCRQNALDKIRSNDLNLLQVVGEIRDSASTILSLVEDVRSIITSVLGVRSGGSPRQLVLSPAKLASEWLRLQYGIKPLMSDIYSSIQVIREGLQSPLARVKSVVIDADYALPVLLSSSGMGPITVSGSVRRGCEVSYHLSLTNSQQFKNWQLGLTDPLSLLWELTSFSFVVDWFLHVGDFLRGLTPPLGLVVTEGYQTLFLKNDILIREDAIPLTGVLSVLEPGSLEARLITSAMSRRVLTGLVGPTPYLDLGLTRGQVANGFALFAALAR